MKISAITLSLITIIIFSTACGNNAPTRTPLTISTTDELSQALDAALVRRVNIISYQPTAEYFTNFAEGRRRMQIVRPWALGTATRGDMDAVVTQANALRDTTALFDMLATEYILYIYLGGDEVFFPVRDRIKEYINTQPYWYAWELSQLFHAHLSAVINNNHSSIGGQLFYIRYGFVVADARFEHTRRGFRNIENGLYIRSLVLPCLPGKALAVNDVMHFSTDENGISFFYSPVIALRVPDVGLPRYLTITYTNGTVEIFPLYIWDNGEASLGNRQYYTSLEFMQGVPVVTISRMANMNVPEDDIRSVVGRQFIAYASQLRDEPVIVVDVRGNPGGFDSLLIQWFYQLLGEVPYRAFISLSLVSNDVRTSIAQGEFWQRMGYDVELFDTASLLDDYHQITHMPGELVQSDQLIILLVDRLSGSASEGMASRMFTMENTLIIGQNTAGVYVTSGAREFFLPNSGIPFQFSQTALIYPPGHFAEGRGFAPDIWVTGCALTATVNMLNNHIIRE